MIITFTDLEGTFFAFNLNHLEGISCHQHSIVIFPLNTPCSSYPVSREEAEKVEKQLEKFAKNT